jgi:hypothetical protein
MLSLSPRYDLFKFSFPKDFLPEVINEKYNKIINKNPGVLTTSIDYLNESIQSITIPGISDINIQQQQHSSNSIKLNDNKTNVEPKTDITYTSSTNPLDKINKEFKVTFRMNHGLYNYFMIYETIFYRICKPFNYGPDKILYIELLGEDGRVASRIKFYDVYIDGIDGLDFTFNKMERDSGTFDVNFKFNNIDFEFIE